MNNYTVELIVRRSDWWNPTKGFEVLRKDWDLGDIISFGKTIQDALDDYLEMHELKHDEELTNYKWRAEVWKQPLTASPTR